MLPLPSEGRPDPRDAQGQPAHMLRSKRPTAPELRNCARTQKPAPGSSCAPRRTEEVWGPQADGRGLRRQSPGSRASPAPSLSPLTPGRAGEAAGALLRVGLGPSSGHSSLPPVQVCERPSCPRPQGHAPRLLGCSCPRRHVRTHTCLTESLGALARPGLHTSQGLCVLPNGKADLADLQDGRCPSR